MTKQEWEFYTEEVETIWIREKQINLYTDLKLIENLKLMQRFGE